MSPPSKRPTPLAGAAWLLALSLMPAQAHTLSTIEVRAEAEDLEGTARAASEGVVSASRLATVPLLRPAEVLEMVPGLVVTQHAGDGKANQYFLRGFNLDHGTDFATWVNGVPINLPSHAHGQGYTDLNFLIPELVERVQYRKGPYHAEDGDFASAGSARIEYLRQLDGPLAQATLGAHGLARTLLAGSPQAGGGRLLYGLELFHNDGPWQVPERYRKANGVLRYSEGTAFDGFTLTAMAYRGAWNSTDQVPQRALDRGLIDRYGTLDPTTGGQTHRLSLSAEAARRGQDRLSQGQLWWLHSGLDLWSNFQYCLNSLAATGSCTQGDQFLQRERRQAFGGTGSHTVAVPGLGLESSHTVGVQARVDRIAPLGLYRSTQRGTTGTVREDRVSQRSLGLWAQNDTRWTPWLRSTAGLRTDAYQFDVTASLAANAGRARDHQISPKFGLVLGPWAGTEFYVNAGRGFHSNDARGTTLTVNPGNPSEAAQRVPPLVPTRGQEVGLRSEWRPGWKQTVALWRLRSASELLFVGDAGTTEPWRPSRRQGLEWNQFIALTPHLALDVDLSWSRARYTDGTAEGAYLPGAVGRTANLGLSWDGHGPWSAALRLRYFGARPLVEDNSLRSSPTTLAHLRLGYRLDARTQLGADVFNLFNRRVNDIEYAYLSQLPGEASPIWDRHLHPAEPRTLRVTVTHRF